MGGRKAKRQATGWNLSEWRAIGLRNRWLKGSIDARIGRIKTPLNALDKLLEHDLDESRAARSREFPPL
jgi:hypothetical protein